ncbi:hypothetical protein GOP47_0014930 [Adiantum capillus-veneris]|uniref:Uncharacterized protein n=1 Tax=Adiantum capillus-veneris TaxID=13818 RepID=A0A9D4UNA1_ADICA|nr:hypothetical protein GOP47_0014930 [Adiantum capillus-veneris]
MHEASTIATLHLQPARNERALQFLPIVGNSDDFSNHTLCGAAEGNRAAPLQATFQVPLSTTQINPAAGCPTPTNAHHSPERILAMFERFYASESMDKPDALADANAAITSAATSFSSAASVASNNAAISATTSGTNPATTGTAVNPDIATISANDGDARHDFQSRQFRVQFPFADGPAIAQLHADVQPQSIANTCREADLFAGQ